MSTTNGKKIELIACSAGDKAGRSVVIATVDGKEIHRHKFDLNNGGHRKKFVREVLEEAFKSDKQADWPEDVRKQLQNDLLREAKVPAGPAEPQTPADKQPEDPRVKALDEIPPDIRVDAEKLLQAPDLFARIGKDFEKCGLAGEEKNRMILYLVGVSAQLTTTLSALIFGMSGRGKSYLLKAVARFFPKQIVLKATRTTSQALYYCGEAINLAHRFLVGGERSRKQGDEDADGTKQFREMAEDGELTLIAKLEGQQQAVEITTKGPVAFAETTTLKPSQIFPEDLTRYLQLHIDDSAEQRRRCVDANMAWAEGEAKASIERICLVHHAMQLSLPRVPVVVPYAKALGSLINPEGWPANSPVERRSKHLIIMIQSSALLHYRQRERRPDGTVIATLDDYENIEPLARVSFGLPVHDLTEDALNFFSELCKKFGSREFTTTEAKETRQTGKRSVDNWLPAMQSQGVVEQIQAGISKEPAVWRLTGVAPDSTSGWIPTVAELAAEISRRGRAHGDEKNAA